MKINTNNPEKIREALRNVNGNCKAHTFTSPGDIAEVIRLAELELKRLKLKAAEWKGAKARATSPAPGTTAYKYRADCTSIELTRSASGWFLTNAERVSVYPSAEASRLSARLKLTQAQGEIVLSRFASTFDVGA